MKKSLLSILIACLFIIGVAGNVYATPYNSFFEDPGLTKYGTIDRFTGTYNNTYKGYTGATWTGYYLGTFSGNDSEVILLDLARYYLDDDTWMADGYDKVDAPANESITDPNDPDYDPTLDNFLVITYDDGDKTGTWDSAPYELGFYAVKGGPEFALYFVVNPYLSSGFWTTEHISNPASNQPTISHLAAMSMAAVPEPMTLILLGFGLIGLAGIRRK